MNNILQMPLETVQDVDVAIDQLLYLQSLYEALAPDWGQAPDWAQWYTIDIDGFAYWHEGEPLFGSMAWGHYGRRERTHFVELPSGIDSRLCKWQRPEVTA